MPRWHSRRVASRKPDANQAIKTRSILQTTSFVRKAVDVLKAPRWDLGATDRWRREFVGATPAPFPG